MRDDETKYRTIDDIKEGDTFSVTEQLSPRDVLLYLGVSNDRNPLFAQRDYVKTTQYHKPPVPILLLMGLMTSTVSNYLPGPGSRITDFEYSAAEVLYPGDTISLRFDVISVNERTRLIGIQVRGSRLSGEKVLEASIKVEPAERLEQSEEGQVHEQ